MKQFLLCFLLFIGVNHSFSQEFSYEFELESITEPGDAKYVIGQIRELVGVKTIKFSDSANEFQILTHLDFTVEEMTTDLELLGFILVGPLVKTELE